MQITRNIFTLSDLNSWFDEKTLVVNKDYQRHGGIWVANARTYLIDTILNGFPFPKITIRQIIDLKTRKVVREIIDGQQRMLTINDFVNNKYALTSVSENFSKKKFEDLDEETQQNFLAYEVSLDMVISASEEEVLEIFRRMNSYTVPLNEAEKRHAEYQGEFKWFIRELIELYTPLFLSFGVFTRKAISRMEDADLMTELVQLFLQGIVSRSPKTLKKLYKDYDVSFAEKDEVREKVDAVFNFIKNFLADVGDTGLLKSYMLYSLFAALVINRYGDIELKGENFEALDPIGEFSIDVNQAKQTILEMFSAVENKDMYGRYGEFVKASTSTTHRPPQRMIRSYWLANALRNTV